MQTQLILTLLLLIPQLLPAQTATDVAIHTHCTRVVDGDTFACYIVLASGDTLPDRVRLLGVDTPERGEPGYQAATDSLRAWIDQHPVQLLVQPTRPRDGFGRLLAVVLDSTGYAVNTRLLDRQLAVPWKD